MTQPGWHATEFRPRRFLSNGHLQTIFGNFLRRADHLPPAEQYLVEVAGAEGSHLPGSHQSGSHLSSQVLCECHWQPAADRASRPTAILLHGLEGSSNSQYVVGNANKVWRAGGNVIRMNMRNCGGTEALSPTLYHSGLSGDVLAVLQFFTRSFGLQSVGLIGYSMGGNIVLKLAGDLGAAPPSQLRSVIGVSPALDLAASSNALLELQNRVYQRRFVRGLLRRFRRKAELFPLIFDTEAAKGVRSVRDFDEQIVSRYCGFAGADDYYQRASAARVLDRIAVPTLILHALDDPFVRITPESCRAIEANPHITLVETAHGGHCAFLAPSAGDNDGYWAEHMALRFLLAHAGTPLRT